MHKIYEAGGTRGHHPWMCSLFPTSTLTLARPWAFLVLIFLGLLGLLLTKRSSVSAFFWSHSHHLLTLMGLEAD